MARTFYNPYERDPVSVEDQITGGTKVIKAFNLDYLIYKLLVQLDLFL